MGATINIIGCRLQEHREVMLPINLTTPRHTTIETAPMLAVIAYKPSDMHHTRAVSHYQRKEDFRLHFMLEGSIPDPQPLLLKRNQMLKPREQE